MILWSRSLKLSETHAEVAIFWNLGIGRLRILQQADRGLFGDSGCYACKSLSHFIRCRVETRASCLLHQLCSRA
jgi:hypothetical protein